MPLYIPAHTDATVNYMNAREQQDPPSSSLESYWPSAPQAGAPSGLPWRHACAFLAFLMLVIAGLALLMRYLGTAH